MKTITVRDKDNNPYTLTFTAETVKALEAKGFSLEKVTDMPMTMIPMLFEGAFLAKSQEITTEKATEIYKLQSDKTGLLTKLLELYNDPIDEVIVKEGNSKWECNF